MNPAFADGPATDPLRDRLDRLQRLALMVGGAGLAICLAARFLWPALMPLSYLVGYQFWVGIGLGCIGLSMLHHLVGGQWGLPVRRPMEAGGLTLVPMAVLFLPLAVDLETLYPWARLDVHGEFTHKRAYLNTSFFLVRTAGYFAVWILLAWLLSGLSRRQDERADHGPSRFLQQLSAPGLVVLFLTSSFAAIDWGMSLEPHWASTIYGAMVVTGEALATLAVMVVVASMLGDQMATGSGVTPGRLHDLGNLMLAFVMLWAYMAFSQFLIIWSGNLSEEAPWYLRRTQGGWEWVALALIAIHFFLPFFVLLFRESKRQGPLLRRVAWLILGMHLVDLTWLVLPAPMLASSPYIPWGQVALVLAATAGIGGIWVAAFLWRLKSAPLVPVHDPHVEIALRHAGAH
jgi:hypothetical protein